MEPGSIRWIDVEVPVALCPSTFSIVNVAAYGGTGFGSMLTFTSIRSESTYVSAEGCNTNSPIPVTTLAANPEGNLCP